LATSPTTDDGKSVNTTPESTTKATARSCASSLTLAGMLRTSSRIPTTARKHDPTMIATTW
jgi:hypothetical protein